MRGLPILDESRRKCLESILKQAAESNADMLVMPECYVPFDYLDIVIEWSQKYQKAVVLGLEHWNVGNVIYNFIVTLLPIEIEGRHRAGGDAKATVKLFEQLLQNDCNNEISSMLKGRGKEQHLPPHLPVDKVAKLPTAPGVYYFAALFVAGTVSGLIAVKPLWAHCVGSIFGQFMYGLLFLTMGPLAAVGLVFFVLWSVIFLGGAYLGSRLRSYFSSSIKNK